MSGASTSTHSPWVKAATCRIAQPTASARLQPTTAFLLSAPVGREADEAQNSSQRPMLCRFLDAGGTKPLGTLGEPASKKRRGTKSRGVWGRVGSQRYGDLIFAPIMTVGAKLAPGGLDRVRKGSWKRALGISVAAWGVSTGGRIVDWRGFAERDRRRRRASAAERESGGARRRSGS